MMSKLNLDDPRLSRSYRLMSRDDLVEFADKLGVAHENLDDYALRKVIAREILLEVLPDSIKGWRQS